MATSTRTSPIASRAQLIAGGVLAAAIVVLALGEHSGPLTPLKAIILGAVEGITEYLPISSTGHLLVTQRLLDLGTGDGKTAADTYAVAIQVGAIFAVVALYWHRIVQMLNGIVGRDREGRELLVKLVVAFLPAAVFGLIGEKVIKEHLFGPWPVVVAWTVGGIFLLVWKPPRGTTGTLADLSMRSALIIGCAQAIAMWPGTSRSLVTIVAALMIGLAMPAALEFSFLLGLATLTAATVLDLGKHGSELIDTYGWRTPLLGALVAFLTAVLAVRWLVSYLRTRPLTIFGWYRLAIAAVTVGLLAANVI